MKRAGGVKKQFLQSQDVASLVLTRLFYATCSGSARIRFGATLLVVDLACGSFQ